MKLLRTLLAALFTTVAVAKGENQPSAKLNADAMREMRLQWLNTKPTAGEASAPDAVGAVLMDWPVGQATATVLASSGGDASLYTTSTFGMIGGIGHENARKAAIAFTACAQRYLKLSVPTTDFSYPAADQIRFFFVTPAEVRSRTVAAGGVEKAGTPANDLFAHAQEVVTALRLITQSQQ